MAATGKGSGTGLFIDVKSLKTKVKEHAAQLADHEERIGINEDRLNRHEQDLADLHTATEALKRIDQRHVEMRVDERTKRRSSRKRTPK